MATDYDCWNESSATVNVENVLKIFQQNVEKIKNILLLAVKEIAAKNWDKIITDLKVRLLSKKKKELTYLYLV